MTRWVPYRFGMWLADHLRSRCCLCQWYAIATDSSTNSFNNSATHPRATTQTLPSVSLSALSLSRPYSTKRSLLCAQCQQLIAWLPPLFTIDINPAFTLSVQSATYYDYPIRQAISAFKHHEDMTKLPVLVHALRQLPKPTGCHEQNSVIVPMPTTTARLQRRGFDPVTILTYYLSQHWQIPIWRGVARVDDTLSQQGLSRAERLANLEDAFTIISLPPKAHLLLFDDVATTGASLRSLAKTLHLTDQHLQLSAYALAHGNQVT